MSEFKPTDQQMHAIDTAKWGEDFVVDAVAGSGKTRTARAICEVLDSRILYLVYNSAAAKDARAAFPSSVKVSTTSALAWGKYPEYRDRMVPGPNYVRVRAKDTAELVGLKHPVKLGNLDLSPVVVASMALETIKKFCYSADGRILPAHVPPILAHGMGELQEDLLRDEVVKWARKIWKQSIEVGSRHLFTFDYAFKLMVLSPPDYGYDTVIIDEAQDSNKATLHLLKAQLNSQIIVIGDPAQQLYSWRGASDIMGEFDGERLPLSKSFRFGTRVAEEAEKWLAHTGTGIHIEGNPAMDSRVVNTPLDRTDAILCRNNATVMGRAIERLDYGDKVAIVGGTDALRKLAFAARDLMAGKRTSYQELSVFSDWAELMAFTEEPAGKDLKALVQLVNQYKVGGILDACNMLVPETPEEASHARRKFTAPDVVISTSHRAKGREWNNVEIANDYEEPDDVEDPMGGLPEPGPINRHDAMLHYVTVTRARENLNRGGLAWIDRHQPVDKLAKTS